MYVTLVRNAAGQALCVIKGVVTPGREEREAIVLAKEHANAWVNQQLINDMDLSKLEPGDLRHVSEMDVTEVIDMMFDGATLSAFHVLGTEEDDA